MKKLNIVAVLFATAAFATAASAQVKAADEGNAINNWQDGSSAQVWKNSDGLCWRDSSWTPATAAAGCDGALQKEVPAAPAVEPTPAPAPAVVPVVPTKETYSADAFFDFDKAVLKPAGKAKLDELAARVQHINLEVIVAVGHTDSTGPAAYNQKLSERRAASVKAYLVSKGINAKRIYTEGKGETQPVASNKTRAGRAKNRRVEIEVVGTTNKPAQ